MSEPEEHRIARTAEGTRINAHNGVKNGKYFCFCPERHRLKFVKSSGKDGVRRFESYFAHISESSGNSKPTCRGGGESQVHMDAKYTLVENFGQYHFKVYECPSCKTSKIWEPKPNARLTLEEVSNDRSWRYDAMVFEEDKPVFAFEVYHTHKTGDKKVERTRKNGIEIAEFDAEDIIHAKKGQCLKNLLCDKSLCEACKIEKSRLAAQQAETAKRAAQIAIEKRLADAAKTEKRKLAAELELKKIMAAQKAESERLAQRNAERHMFSAWNLERSVVSESDSEQYYQWTSVAMPLPVPAEAIDFTPSELWPLVWQEYPEGIVMPASVPRAVWEKQWKLRNPVLAQSTKCPPPPPFVKGYWGKLNDRALTSRKRKVGKDCEEEKEKLPPVWQPHCSAVLWRSYFELFPDGHSAPPYEPPFAYEEPPKKHAILNGQLHVNVGRLLDRPIWKPSTGVDAWDPRGNWIGPG